MTDAEVRRPVVAWLWGGGLLAASAVVPILVPGTLGSPVLGWAGRLLFLAAMVVFAFGVGGTGSVVARRVPGVVALVVLGVAQPVFEVVITLVAGAGGAATADGLPPSLLALQLLGYGQLVVSAGAALVAVIEIARARVVPDPWRWAPTWALAVVAGLFVITQLVGMTAPSVGTQPLAVAAAISAAVGGALAPLALGIAAMVLGARGKPTASARIYPPT